MLGNQYIQRTIESMLPLLSTEARTALEDLIAILTHEITDETRQILASSQQLLENHGETFSAPQAHILQRIQRHARTIQLLLDELWYGTNMVAENDVQQ